jgi:hypothetical protein
LLEGFADLVGERYGYFMARRLTQQDMGEKCKAELKAVREKNKEISEAWDKLLETPTAEIVETIKAGMTELKDLRKTASDATKPFRDKIAPLAKAMKWMDNVAIPDSLKELGKEVAPRFSLSEVVTKALEAAKKRA